MGNLQGRAFADLPGGVTGDVACVIDGAAGLWAGQTIGVGGGTAPYIVAFIAGAWTVMGFGPSAWHTYSPAMDSSAGSAGTAAFTASGRYYQIGKSVTFGVDLKWTNAGSWTGNTQFTLPVTALADGSASFIAFFGRDVVNLYGLDTVGISTTKVRIFKYDGTGIAVNTTDHYIVQGTYEAA